jgi:hypothetical protein
MVMADAYALNYVIFFCLFLPRPYSLSPLLFLLLLLVAFSPSFFSFIPIFLPLPVSLSLILQFHSFILLPELAVITLDFTYAKDIFRFDVCGALTQDQAIQHLEKAKNWTTSAVQFFLNQQEPAAAAVSSTIAFVESLFQANHGNNC